MNRFYSIVIACVLPAVAGVGCAAPYVTSGALMTTMETATSATFKAEVQDSDVPVLVLFQDPGCSVCAPVAALLDKTASEYDGWIRFVKLDVNGCRPVVKSAGIEAVPTLVLYDGRKILDRKVGMIETDELRSMLNRALDIDNP